MVRALLPAMPVVLIACGNAGCSSGSDIELLVYEALVITPQSPTSARVAEHRTIVELSPCPSEPCPSEPCPLEPIEVAGSFGDALLTPFAPCSASANWPDGPVTTVKVTSSLGDVTATFAEGAFAQAVLTPTTPNGMVCGNPYAVTWDPPQDVEGAERTRTASVQWFPDLPPGCEYAGDFTANVPAANPITFVPPAVCPGSTSLTTGTLAVQLSESDRPGGQGSATSCEGARACTYYRGGNVALLRTSYWCSLR
jgi:hypothetical protein